MKLNECAAEASVLAALANGFMPDELAAHLTSCPVCQDAKLVWSYLAECAGAETETGIPPAGVLWWKAQLARKRAAARRSIAWIEAMQKIAAAVVAAAMMAMGLWLAPKMIEIPRMLLAALAAVVILFLASVAVLFAFGRNTQPRTLPRGM